MDIDGAVQAKALKFRELVYAIETGEAEMISVDFVARGGGNATAVEGSPSTAKKAEAAPVDDDKKGKGKGKQKEKEKAKEETIDESAVMTAEDEESKLHSCMSSCGANNLQFFQHSQQKRTPSAC